MEFSNEDILSMEDLLDRLENKGYSLEDMQDLFDLAVDELGLEEIWENDWENDIDEY